MLNPVKILRNRLARWSPAELLHIDDFRYLWLSNIIWWQNRWMEDLIVGWVVLELTDSPEQVALVGFYRSAPFLFLGPFIGTVVQRFTYRWLIINSQLITTVITAALGLLALSGYLAFWQVAVGSILIGFGGAFDWSSRRALIPDLVGKERTMDAMMLETMPQNISRVAGPFLSGVILETLGVRWCFPVLTFLAIVGLVFLFKLSARVARTDEKVTGSSPWKDLREGLRYAGQSQGLIGVLGITLFMNAFMFPYQTLLPVFARDILHQGPFELGIMASCVGVGSFIGVGAINRWRRNRSAAWIFAVCSLLSAASIAIFALSNSYALSVVMLLITGVGQAGFGIMQSSMILQNTSDAMRARVMGVLVLAIGGGPPGRLQIGGLTGLFGAAHALFISACAAAAGIGLVWWRLPGFRQAR